MQTDSIFRNLPKLLPEEENEVYVGKSAGKNVSTIVTMGFSENPRVGWRRQPDEL